MTAITSRRNPKIRQARALRRRKTRDETGLCLAEGIWHVGEALAAGAPVQEIFYAPDLLTSDFAFALIEKAENEGLPCHSTTPHVFTALAEKERPQGIIAVVRQPRVRLPDLAPGNFPWGVALVAPQDPGNLGTVLRTIDAVGASGLLLLDGGADPWHPTAVRASMGAVFWLPVVQASFSEFAAWAGTHGYAVYGASARGAAELPPQGTFARPSILLMGSEREGLSEEQANVCAALYRLPMEGRVRSLNLAVATGVFLYRML